MNPFKIIAFSIMSLFLFILALTTLFAYSRGFSGTTGLDMAKVQKMRNESMRQVDLRP